MKCKDCKFWTRNKIYKNTTERTNYKNEVYIAETFERNNDYDHCKMPDGTPFVKLLKSEEIVSRFGKCSNENFIFTEAGGYIQKDDVVYADRPDTLLFSDSDGYSAYLLTGEAFGCVHFAATPQLSRENIYDL